MIFALAKKKMQQDISCTQTEVWESKDFISESTGTM